MTTEPTGQKKKSLRRTRIWVVILLFSGMAILYHTTSFLRAYGHFLNVGLPLAQPVDAVFVLGGDVMTRPFVAVEIFRADYAKELLYCGLADLKDQGRMVQGTEDLIISKLLDACDLQHVPRKSIGMNANSTIDEAKALNRYLDEHPQSKVAIVTNNYHSRRSRRIFQYHCASYKDQLFIVSAPTDHYDPHTWFYSSEGRLYYCFEGLKLLTTYLPGGID